MLFAPFVLIGYTPCKIDSVAPSALALVVPSANEDVRLVDFHLGMYRRP